MLIETTFMRYRQGHGRKGIIEITLKPEALKVWALSLHICGAIEKSIDSMIDGNKETIAVVHKEEGKVKMENDSKDHDALEEKIAIIIHPLNVDAHPECPVNVVTGSISPETVNVDEAVMIGTQQMQEFKELLPNGLHEKIKKKVVTMTESKKHITVGIKRCVIQVSSTQG